MTSPQRKLVSCPLHFVFIAFAAVQLVPLSYASPHAAPALVHYSEHPGPSLKLVPLHRPRRQAAETNGIGTESQSGVGGQQGSPAAVTSLPSTTTSTTSTTTTTAAAAAAAAAGDGASGDASPAPAAPPAAPAAPSAAPAAPAATTEAPTPAAATEASYDELDSFERGTNHSYHINGTEVEAVTIDDHKYYESRFVPQGRHYWVDLNQRPNVVKHDMLSEAHRRAARVPLDFDFPFYGHIINNITIATGGFLYTGDYLHSWLAATQYIAPLMANFDTTITKDSVIKYSANATSLTVQWEKVPLQEANNTAFSFQVTIHKSGNVVFAYRDIPVNISGIKTQAHPVKVGMSDAYIIDRTIFYVKRKTIYEYHRIDMKGYTISNNTAVVFTAQPTCVSLQSCDKCLNHPSIDFKCAWCLTTKSCSDGLDRYRQSWLESRCDDNYVQDAAQCGAAATTPPPPPPPAATGGGDTPSVGPGDAAAAAPAAAAAAHSDAAKQGGGGMSSSAVATVITLVALVVAVAGWVTYAYLFPHSTSGQILIRYRPSQWRMRRGEARYTAASIHM